MTATATPRNEAAERLLTNISAQLTRNSDYIRLRDLLDSALAHERQQGREEAAAVMVAARDVVLQEGRYPPTKNTHALAETFKSLVVVPKVTLRRLEAALDAIASPSEEPKNG